jgi:uncharacterized protein (UPF0335 family)
MSRQAKWRSAVNGLLTTVTGLPCSASGDPGFSRGRVDQEKTMSGPGGIAGDQLRAFVERIEHIEEEIKGLTEDKKDIYAEAKGNGFDVKILREVIRIRKQDQKERDEQESLLDVYLHALETAAPVAQAA